MQTKPDIEKVIGHITVDSGQVLLADPCYLLVDSKEKRDTRTWQNFAKVGIRKTGASKDYFSISVNELSGKKKGDDKSQMICTGSGHGDGVYPVLAVLDGNTKRVKKLEIDFTYNLFF